MSAHLLNQKVDMSMCVSLSVPMMSICLFPDQHCLVCLTSHGHIVIFSLPKVKVLFDVDSKLPVNEMRYDEPYISKYSIETLTPNACRIWRTFAMGNHGEALYMGSGTEIQRISVLQNDGYNTLMLCDCTTYVDVHG